MLEIQKWLLSQNLPLSENLQKLQNELGIYAKIDEPTNRVILDYDQIESDKLNPIVRECRGIILNTEDYSLIARGFSRFLNYSEDADDTAKFNWNDKVICTEKVDGSLIILYYYLGQFWTNTRFSFANSEVNNCGKTWSELVFSCINTTKLSPALTYILELSSPFSQVVRYYPEPRVSLLSTFISDCELAWSSTVKESEKCGIKLTNSYEVSSYEDVQVLLKIESEKDKTFEGWVIRDINDHRLKIKSPEYLYLHRAVNNNNLSNVKNLVPLILSGEKSEILTYFPAVREQFEKLEGDVEDIKSLLMKVWERAKDIESQKDFALEIMKDLNYTSPLFSARKCGGSPLDYITSEQLVKILDK